MNRPRAFLSLLAALLPVLGACSGTPDPTNEPVSSETLVMTNGVVIDGTGAAPIRDGAVIIKGNRITAVDQSADLSIPPEAQIVDVQGGTILPGFIDSHVHSTADPAVRRDFLTGGVTAVCDLGSTLDDMPQFELEESDEGPVARVFNSGPIMTAPGGAPDVILHVDYNYEVASPEEARQGVKDLIGRGADVIKVYLEPRANQESMPMLDAERLRAIVEEAHASGLLVRAHVTNFEVLPMALEAGVDTIEHVPGFSLSASEIERLTNSADPGQELLEILDLEAYDRLLQQMADDGVVVVPTLDRLLGNLYRKVDPTPLEKMNLDSYLFFIGNFHGLGGVLALGTDFNVDIGMTRGIPIGELEILLAGGLTPMEVIEASTRHAATACGQGDVLGTLEPGKIADLIVVDGDPLADITLLSNVVTVVKDGQIVKEAP